MTTLMILKMVKMTSYLNLLKENKCFCYKKQKVISLTDCNIADCHREKSCRKATNNKIDKEIKDERKKKI